MTMDKMAYNSSAVNCCGSSRLTVVMATAFLFIIVFIPLILLRDLLAKRVNRALCAKCKTYFSSTRNMFLPSHGLIFSALALLQKCKSLTQLIRYLSSGLPKTLFPLLLFTPLYKSLAFTLNTLSTLTDLTALRPNSLT